MRDFPRRISRTTLWYMLSVQDLDAQFVLGRLKSLQALKINQSCAKSNRAPYILILWFRFITLRGLLFSFCDPKPLIKPQTFT
jgi:hypothetical protein